MRVEIECSYEYGKWSAFQREDIFQRLLIYILERIGISSKRVIFLSILLTDDDGVRDLNRTYRHIDKATNVLSFPCNFLDMLELEACANSDILLQSDMVCFDDVDNWDDIQESLCLERELLLGSLAFAYQTIYDESCMYNKSFDEHMCHLFVHGVLHLLGYDHIDEQERQDMEALEIEILHNFGFGNPYELGEVCGSC